MRMCIHIGLDDTDSAKGMCTTYAVTELIRVLDYPVLLGYPRLVRLNPNIPWKTRGNGALSFTIGGAAKTGFRIGEIAGKPVLTSFEADGESLDTRNIAEKVSAAIGEIAELDEENTNPGVIVCASRPPSSLYWRAVRYVVDREEAVAACRTADAIVTEWKNGRGIIGASAAVAWQPGRRTYEVITYRDRARWGRARQVSEEDASMLDERFPSTFNNYDTETRHMCISPASPCPVLFGIRGSDPAVLPGAMESIRSEHIDRWLIFESNQGTDDHIIRLSQEPEQFCSYAVTGQVATKPATIPGGHVFFELRYGTRTITCAAFEETKHLRNIVRKLVPGDDVTVWGAYKAGLKGAALNLEKIQILSLVKRFVKVGNPLCTNCGKSMESIGRGMGYRCRACGTKAYEPRLREVDCELSTGVYSTTTSSRRHLSEPSELMVGRVIEKAANN
ncbi:MAG: tRNA(Ile)(2)-agmatinylcytidine synthase [Methanomassiliicoccales archaeon]|nr:tRNA(Ile)(2)-agmatinylcytidine synthase [Methanomassiliicoccales archaeon]